MKWLPSLRRESLDDIGPPHAAASGASPRVDADADRPQPEVAPTAGSGGEPENDELAESPTETTTAELSAQDLQSLAARLNEPSALAAAPDTAALLAQLRDDFSSKHQALSDGQRSLNQLFATRLRSDEAQVRAVEKLHSELQQYKANFVRQQLLPLLKEVIFCHDFLTGEIERLTIATSADVAAEDQPRGPVPEQKQLPASPADGDRTDTVEPCTEPADDSPGAALHFDASDPAAEQPAVTALETARQMLVDLMFKYDVEPYRNEGDAFDPKWQQCTRTVLTGHAEFDKTVAARGSEGFRTPDAVVRREQVTVYKFTPGAD